MKETDERRGLRGGLLLLCPTIHTLHLVRAQQYATADVFPAIVDRIEAIQLENTGGGHGGRLKEFTSHHSRAEQSKGMQSLERNKAQNKRQQN